MIQSIKTNKNSYKKILLPFVPPVPTMITDDEKQYLYWLGRNVISSEGAIVEIGTWFGSSAGYLGAGLRDAGRKIPFYCFDRFELQGIEKRKARDQGFDHIEELEKDSDIMPITDQHLKSIYPIQLSKTYIDKILWAGGKIELLHLDAPKRESDISHVLKTFLPFLIPGKSIIVLQDFGMPRAYALPLIFGNLSDYFELVDIPSQNSTMAVFMYRKEIPTGILELFNARILRQAQDERKKKVQQAARPELVEGCEWNINDWSPSQAQRIWNQMASHYTNPSQRAFFNFGLALYFFRNGQKELAVKIVKENAPYLSADKALLLDKRLCSRLWKLAFKS